MTEAPKEKTTATKSTEMAKKVRGMVKTMYQRTHEAKAQGQPIIYSFLGSQTDEIMRAMDIIPVYPENYAGLCAAKQDAERFLIKAQSEGFSNNLCTYAMCGLGFDVMRRELGEMPLNSPDGGMERPDAMLGLGMDICDPRYKWFQSVQRYMDVPMHVIGLLWPPFDANIKEVEQYYVDYMFEELRNVVEFMQRVTGRQLDLDRLSYLIDISDETDRTRYEAYQLRKAVPAVMPTQDAMNTMVPAGFLRGTEEALNFYKELYKELKYRVDNKIGVIPNEKYRILWGGGLPPWFALSIFNYFENLGAVFPIEGAYRPPMPVEIPARVTHPLERLAWRHFRRVTPKHTEAMNHSGVPEVEFLLEMIEDYRIDAVVWHRAVTCRTLHIGQMHELNVLKQYRDLPCLILESDIVDVRSFDKIGTENKIDSFIEMIENFKKDKGVKNDI
ncbi:2-hydroxyacyl-CoA dehydratase subunit D [Chloroflexota bacterium]